MSELVFLKLGGSLITDKTRDQTLRADVLHRLAKEISAALSERPDMQLLVGHGSGSYGHMVARRYGTRDGVGSPEQWRGYAETACVAARLNRLVLDALQAAGIPVLPIQPSASALCRDGELRLLDERPIHAALANGLVPVVYGDVALDEVRGGTIISTEQIFRWLAYHLGPQRVLLVGEVPGVLSVDPARRPAGSDDSDAGHLIDEVTPLRLSGIERMLGGSRGVDVTGGMLAKVREMTSLVQGVPELCEVRLFSGLEPDLLRVVLADPHAQVGTRIHAESIV